MITRTKSELQMLRELVWLLVGKRKLTCFFCSEPLLEADHLTFGHHHHPPLKELITVHHIDFDRANNTNENLALCHRSCHKSFHRKVALQEVRGAAKEGEVTQDRQLQHS